MAGSTEVGRAHVTLTADEAPLEQGLEGARQAVVGWVNNLTTGVLQGFGQAIFNNVIRGFDALKDKVEQSIQDASDLTESINKVGVAFADSSEDILGWSQSSATAFGQSRQQALEAASSFGLLFRTIGVGSDQSAAMSKSLVELAADLASINNIPVASALEKLQAGLIGEVRPLREVGVLLNENVVAQEAVKLGLADSTKAVSDQQKVLARYQLILDQTKLSQGDFARTSDQLANAQRILAAQVQDASAQFGQALVPVQLAFTRGLSQLITTVQPYGVRIMDALAGGLADGIVAILPVLAQLRALFTYWLKPGSPPKLLPDLDDWAKETMQVYLDSWGDADFNSLKSLGGTIEDILRSFVASGQLNETDLVKRVFGGRKAIEDAVDEFRRLGTVSEDTLSRVADAAGPAGDKVADLARQYFALQEAAQQVTDAQSDLNRVTQKYADALDPINAQLDAVRRKQEEIRNQERLAELGKTLTDPTATVDDKQLARLEIQQIELEKQADAVGRERDAAVKAAQDKVDAAKKEQDAQQQKLNAVQDTIDQQTKTNQLIGEEITLRQRLSDEADAQAKKVADAQERIHQAQLNYNLALTDTAGQIALLQGELAKTTQGSAEYYDLLTRIVGLQEKLKNEQAGGDLLAPLTGGDTQTLTQQSEGIKKLSDALSQAFDVLSGSGGKEVKLNPAFQGFADAVGTIQTAVDNAIPGIQSIISLIFGNGQDTSGLTPFWQDIYKNIADLKTTLGDAKPVVQDFFDVLFGRDSSNPNNLSTADVLRPTGSNGAGIWGAIVPMIRGIVSAITLIKDGEWSALWNGLKVIMNSWLTSQDPNGDPNSLTMLGWINNKLIPAIDALRVGEWRRAWKDLGGEAVDAMLAGMVTSKSGQAMLQLALDLIAHDGLAFMRDFGKLFGDSGGSASPPSSAPSGGDTFDWGQILRDAIRDAFKGIPMPNIPLPVVPQSFQTPSGVNGAPLLTAASAGGGMGTTIYQTVYQTIGTGGDFGGARQGAADGIRQALVAGKLT